jgi:magnesium transporter
MFKMLKKVAAKKSMPPGSMIHVGDQKVARMTIDRFDYREDFLEEHIRQEFFPELFFRKNDKTISWINIHGLHEVDRIEKIGQLLDIHPIIMEDILNTYKRPKYDDYENCFFVVLRMLAYDEEKREIKSEQVSFLLLDHLLVSFQENVGDVFDAIRQRIRSGKGRIRKMGVDYLLYSLIDAVVDNYYAILDAIGEDIEILEEGLMTDPKEELLKTIHHLKREMIFIRKSIWPLREIINGLLKSESKLILKKTAMFFKDLYDHIVQIIDITETIRDVLSSLQDLYLSSISNKTNQVMKVLTIIATIFIPITFIVGVYGMNFEFMPELKWKYGYFIIWGIMAIIISSLLWFFKRKKWF